MLGHYSHVLVPTDFRPAAREAYRVALAVASASSARVTLLHVTPTPAAEPASGIDAIDRLHQTLWAPDGESPVVSTFFNKEASRRLAEQRLDRELHPEWRGPLDVRLEWRWGQVPTEVVRYCREAEVDLVVLPVKRRRPWLTMGRDLADRIARQTHLPVLLVRAGEPSAAER